MRRMEEAHTSALSVELVGGPFDGLAMTVLPGERTIVRRSGDLLHEYRSDRDRPGRMDHARVWRDSQEG